MRGENLCHFSKVNNLRKHLKNSSQTISTRRSDIKQAGGLESEEEGVKAV